MDASRYVVCLWPGLPELWYRGRWNALAPAVVFAAAFNFLLVARFVYPEWLLPSLVRIACWVGVGLWIMLVVRAAGRLPALLHPRAVADVPDRYAEARSHYLRGEWPEAEAVLADCLQVDERDCQALLMLVGVYRLSGRHEAAIQTLEQLQRLETADAWWLECQTERRRLEKHLEPAEPEEDESAESMPERTEDPISSAENAEAGADEIRPAEGAEGEEPTGMVGVAAENGDRSGARTSYPE